LSKSGKISNLAQFLLEPDISRICKKGRISAGARTKLRYSPNYIRNFL